MKKLNLKTRVALVYNLFDSLKADEIGLVDLFLSESTQLTNLITIDETFTKLKLTGSSNSILDQKICYNLVSAFDEDSSNLERIVSHLHPIKIGTWLELSKDFSDLGWVLFFNSLKKMPFEINTDPNITERINNWMSQNETTSIVSISQQFIDESSYTEILIQTGEVDIQEKITIMNSFFHALDLTKIHEDFHKNLHELDLKELDLVLGIVDSEVGKVGLRVNQPSREQFLFFGQMSPLFNTEKVIIFENIIENKIPESLTFCMYPEGWKANYSYSLD